MIIIKQSKWTNSLNADIQDHIVGVDTDLINITNCLNGRVRFGTGTDGQSGENLAGEFQNFTSNGSANTEFNVAHTIGSVPIGYIILWQDKAGSLYQGPATGTAWTASQISLKCSVASVNFLIFLLR